MRRMIPGLGAVLALGAIGLAGCSSTPAHRASSTTTSVATGDTGETTSTLAYDPAPPSGPATAPTPASTTTTASPPTTTAPGIVLTVSGASPAGQVTIDVGGQETQHTGVALPWSETLPDNPAIVVLGSQTSSGDPSATITCSIAPPGQSPVTNTSTGAYATVTCEDNVQ